jgi:hypothetical protein
MNLLVGRLANTGNIKKIIFLGSKERLVRGADNISAVFEPIV